jgi:enoyl-CoA hydratase/carnithine racemase
MPKSSIELSTIKVDIDEMGIAWLTLNRPLKGNTRTVVMRSELADTYRRLSADDNVKVLVITGEGAKFFCAGMDLEEISRRSAEERQGDLSTVPDLELLALFPKPTIACVNGYALGGGLEIALACDIRVVATGAKLGLPEVKHGFFPGGGASLLLPKEVGFGRALAMMYSGEPITSGEAVAFGLAVDEYPLDILREKVQLMAKSFAKNSLNALRAVKASAIDAKELPYSQARSRDIARLMELL